MTSSLPFAFPLSQADILHRRAMILTSLCARDGGFSQLPACSLAPGTLDAMFRLYDELFFSRLLARSYGELRVTLSSRLTSSAGKFIYARNAARRMQRAEIRMSSDFLFRLQKGPFLLNGLRVATPQEAFLVVFEHELCHAAETAIYGATGHSKRFLTLANGLFGHTDTRHSLPTRREDAAKDGLLVGSSVCFPFEGKKLRGLITYIGKTATVMVPDARGTYRDRVGRRYAKYRVPVSLLEKAP